MQIFETGDEFLNRLGDTILANIGAFDRREFACHLMTCLDSPIFDLPAVSPLGPAVGTLVAGVADFGDIVLAGKSRLWRFPAQRPKHITTDMRPHRQGRANPFHE